MQTHTLPRPASPIAPPSAAERLVQLGRAADTTRATYEAALRAAFGARWLDWAANASQPNPHPHRPGLTAHRDAWVQAVRDYGDAYRAYHMPRGEG